MNRSDSLQNNLSTQRILSLGIVLVGVFAIYVGRLFVLQVIEYESYQQQADENRTNVINDPALRGIIYDRNGYILAQNIPSYHVVITPVELPDDEGEIQRIFRDLSRMIDLPVHGGILDNINNPYVPCRSNHGIAEIVEYGETTAPYRTVRVKCDIPREAAMVILEKSMDWPGVSIEVESLRDYPTGSLTASFIGYLGPISEQNKEYYEAKNFITDRDKVGYAGLERAFQDTLAGTNGSSVVELDAAGRVIRNLETPIDPIPGNNMILTIDTRLQEAAEAILVDEMTYWNNYFRDKPERQQTSGVVIAMNPTTGEILAMISYPTYENNRLARLIPAYYYEQLAADARKPLLNHAVGDNLPAGSVFKLTTAVGVLNERVVTPEQIIETPGTIYIEEQYAPNDPNSLGREPRAFVDWNRAGFGELDFVHAIANSSNVYFYKVGGGFGDEVEYPGLGICRLGAYAKALGYGDYPGTGLPEEEDGLIPNPDYKRESGGESWALGDTFLVSVGQGYVLATPLQILMSAATIANDGKLVNPTLVREIVDGEGRVVQPFEPALRWDLTKDAIVEEFEAEPSIRGCESTGNYKTIESWVFDRIQEGMRLAVLEGTLKNTGMNNLEVEGLGRIPAAGKTGTAEYCDEYAKVYHTCDYGAWPSHAWTVAYAPYDNPEIAVVAFVYNGNEGSSVAGPIASRVLQAYFEFKAIDLANGQ
ncbi:MAG: penicillin-binding protein 2 [Chloroflexi bacterium]|nr:MAG: penicillin-binding protein 2 [Chloroflexota bacterium]